jgi:hypothetical protein
MLLKLFCAVLIGFLTSGIECISCFQYKMVETLPGLAVLR